MDDVPARKADISIHAPRVGGDETRGFTGISDDYFNPRPPCGGRRRRRPGQLRTVLFQSTPPVWGATSSATMIGMASRLFQSTPPVWGATCVPLPGGRPGNEFQSTPPVWGATSATLQTSSARIFQSTPPVWGATHRINREDLITAPFQSTPPVWGATVVLRDKKIDGEISIHAPRVGGDRLRRWRRPRRFYFNPRPPCGGRHILVS